MEQTSSNKLLLPLAIIVAGGLIAFAIYATKGSSDKQTDIISADADEISIQPISSRDHILGNPNAPLVFVEYSDTECPFCKAFHTTMHKLTDTYGKDGTISWVYRHFPIVQLHSKAPRESEAQECAYELGGANGFWKYTDRIYEITPSNDALDPVELTNIAEFAGLDKTAFNSCLASGRYTETIKTAVEDAVKAGARGTPYTVILLQEKAPKTLKPLLESASLQLRLPPGTLGITPDERKIIVSGNMPYELLEQIVQLVKK